MRAIAIITARGGSKRIPKKNIRDFCGRPIIAYSIEAAIKSNLFGEVMVSTDDKEIAEIAISYGAKVPFYRSYENSNDYATTAEVLLEVIEKYEDNGEKFDVVCCIYPTAPFITETELINAYDNLIKSSANALVPVVKFSYPPQRCFCINDNKLKYKYPENINKRSQDLEKFYHDAGQFYLVKTKELKIYKKLVLENTLPYIMSELEVQDIDNLEDWKIAELKYNLKQEKLK